MANIRIDTDGLQNNISSMRAYVNELDSLMRGRSHFWHRLLLPGRERRARRILIL